MLLNRKPKLSAVLMAVMLINLAVGVQARDANWKKPSTQKKSLLKTAAGCTNATAAIDLDINNVRARIMTGGDLWWDPGTSEARYEIPKDSRKSSLYAGALWVGGYDQGGNLKVTAQTYRTSGNDYWTGPLDNRNNIDAATCSQWDRFWKVEAADVLRFRELVLQGTANVMGADFDDIRSWPARGNIDVIGADGNSITSLANTTREYAPFVNVGGDPLKYEWQLGDYPDIRGDQYIWRVYNDMGNVKTQSGSQGIGLEVQASSFAYSTKDYLNDASFYNYRLINRGSQQLDSCYAATWTDADLGYYLDDYIGCDTARGLGILYNASGVDGTGAANHYGSQVPMVAVDFFIGPKRYFLNPRTGVEDTFVKLKMSNFTYFTQLNGAPAAIADPTNAREFYNYMTGSNKIGDPFTNDFTGAATPTRGYGAGPRAGAVFWGDPDVPNTWSECFSKNTPGDRRFVHSAGPFKLTGGGVTNDITIGVCWVADVGGCPNTNFSRIRVADDVIQDLFDSDFRTIEGPEAPRLVIREMDRKLVFYMVNDSNSTNYKEQFGYNLSDQKYRVSNRKMRDYAATHRNADSLYRFEGYRVFQLKNNEVQPAQIFNEFGEVDNSVAVEVFQCDIRNNVTKITNHIRNTKNTQRVDYDDPLKVTGRDSGITHSFQLTSDAFSTLPDKTFVNYRSYYFVAIAYAHNDFASFKPDSLATTQDIPYLESAHGAGYTPIPVYSVMPNPANGSMGTVLNADYGSGVIIKREEGTGNGGRVLQLDSASEATALNANSGYWAKTPTYVEGAGPVNVKVVDPLKVVDATWELYINGTEYGVNSDRGIIPDSGRWRLVMTSGTGSPVTVTSEGNIRLLNEQIIEKYGLSINVVQTVRPGDDQVNNNGYITSDITYADQARVWLAGVPDGEDQVFTNWIRSGARTYPATPAPPCDYNDFTFDTSGQFYESMFANNDLTKGSWAPYALAASENRSACGFGVANNNGKGVTLSTLPSVDLVFTSDKSKWTRCVVLEAQDDATLAEGGIAKFGIRKHAGWNMDVMPNTNGTVARYSTDPADEGFSYFPGYAVNQETGERLNIVFTEDSWQKRENGSDMIWNPTSTLLNQLGDVSFGGKHYVYISSSRYDGGASIKNTLTTGSVVNRVRLFQAFTYVGVPLLSPTAQYQSLENGIIPTTTRLRFRVSRPYARYNDLGITARNNGLPLYSFSTMGMGPKPVSDVANMYSSDKQRLLDMINITPNPYYGYTGYENGRLDTRVRIINLPPAAEVSIYSLDGSLVRRLSKSNANTSYLDWDIRNAKGLPVASGMYVIHVKADGIGETVLRWFGATRPVDIVTF